MARVVVTGASGFVGSHLVEHLVAAGDSVLGVDRGTPSLPVAEHVTANLLDEDAVAGVIGPGVDVVYHLASVVGVDNYVERPLDVVDSNVLGTRNVLAAATRAGAKVVYASTSEVFGKNPAVPWSEDADRVLGSTGTARWCYASSKAVAEHLVYGFIQQHGLAATIVRYFNLYGPRQRPAFVVSRSIHRALNGLAPVVYDDGGQTRSFTYVGDVIAATALAGSSAKADGESFNLGSSEETTVRATVELIAELTGVRADIQRVDTNARIGQAFQDLPRRIPDTRKAAEVLGWRHHTSLREGLATTVEWAHAQPAWLAQVDSGAA
ncbi:UDP-glucose 4-epimerase [Crossiella equi]|uniref:UDP-glucose 4-epimerase n=1 Tax=Crossiella equi TaxID=130796 RepID=A0ABS5AB45_9PSEU|nr:NAD-dependent epimerase/dehydratase family protein [Crossiella equi]MBP2473517.1 UDP-glucose 4-epimerase [Crossiella equi]